MAQPPYVQRGADGNSQTRLRVDAGRLWMGGLVTAREGTLGNANTARLALLHLLLVSTPRPFRFFTWIVSLLTMVAVLAPFMTDAKLDTKAATDAINLAIGMAIGSLLSGVARSAIRLASQGGRFPPT